MDDHQKQRVDDLLKAKEVARLRATDSSPRAQRRAQAAERSRQRRKGQRAYTRKELAREREAGSLAQLFRIVDREVALPRHIFERAQLAIDDRIRSLQKDHPDWTPKQAVEYLREQARAVRV